VREAFRHALGGRPGPVYLEFAPELFRDQVDEDADPVLDPAAYRAYLEAHRAAVEDFQDGVRYLELDLFSRLTTREYLACYREAGFVVQDLILELSRQALAFKERFPGEFREIWATQAGRCAPDDLLIKAHLVVLRKPAEAQ